MGGHFPQIQEVMLKLGVIFPQTEIGSDPIAVRDFAQAAESLGYEHLRVLEHVLGADASLGFSSR